MLEREQILRALARIAELLRERNVQGEICLLGGTAMVLAFKARPSTKDVDAIFEPTSEIREAARIVAAEQDLPDEWLNDAAKGFVSSRHEAASGDLPQFEGLRITAPTPEYMLAMKCMASRIGYAGDEPSNVGDIRHLIHHLDLKTSEQALGTVARFYPSDRVPARTAFLLEDLFSEGSQ